MHRSSRLILALAFAAGCAPTCGALCDKLDGCGLTTSIGREECRASCETQLADLQAREDLDPLQAFDAQRTCIGASTCDEVEAGACWDGELGPFDLDQGG